MEERNGKSIYSGQPLAVRLAWIGFMLMIVYAAFETGRMNCMKAAGSFRYLVDFGVSALAGLTALWLVAREIYLYVTARRTKKDAEAKQPSL